MLTEIFAIISPVLICAGIGFCWSKTGTDYPADFISRIVMNVGAPCLILSSLLKVDADFSQLGFVAEAAVIVVIAMLLMGLAMVRLLKLDGATYLPPLIFANTGNMGLSITFFAFGDAGLALAVCYFITTLFLHFTLGIYLVSGGQGHWSDQLKELVRQPVLYAMLVGMVMLFADLESPKWLSNTVGLIGGITIPLMLITLGVSLASLQFESLRRSSLFAAMRVFGGLAVGWLICDLLDLTGVTRGVILLQASMPVAVFNYLFAHKYKRNAEEVAGTVIVSTLMAFALLPFLVAHLIAT
ncbi:AEC family transporter [Maricurvus nonylphenolicus]|uniref:AEC family transporter n=1 Tax=Maricurvus nonylphenolicus TaxID=1008307 RepID=UPI0036F28493